MSELGDPAAADFTARARVFWQGRGGHLTFVRQIICGCVAARDLPFTAEDLWREARKIDQGISMASVYRTLADLVQAGMVRDIPHANEQRMFVRADAEVAGKGFLFCKNCARVVPLEDDCLALREGAAIRELGFQPAGMRLMIEADCEAIKNTGSCEHCAEPSMDS